MSRAYFSKGVAFQSPRRRPSLEHSTTSRRYLLQEKMPSMEMETTNGIPSVCRSDTAMLLQSPPRIIEFHYGCLDARGRHIAPPPKRCGSISAESASGSEAETVPAAWSKESVRVIKGDCFSGRRPEKAIERGEASLPLSNDEEDAFR